MTAKEKIIKKINHLSTGILKEMVIILNNDFRPGAGKLFEIILDEIELRLSEKEFIDFCERL